MTVKLAHASLSFLVLLFSAYVMLHVDFIPGGICYVISCMIFGHYADVAFREWRKHD